MRRDPEFFEQAELDLLYMARTLRDALKLERILGEAAVDYLIETGTYTAGFLLKRELAGVFFYVAPQIAEQARQLLSANGYRPYTGE